VIPATIDGVVLRPYRMEDASAVAEAIERSRAHLRRWMAWAHTSTTIDDAASFLAQAVDAEHRGVGLHCGLFDGDLVVGGVGADFHAVDLSAELGYWVAEDRQSTGLATAAARHLVDHLLTAENMYRLVIRAATGNLPSRALAERLGFTHEGTAREDGLVGGRRFDLEVYSLLAPEWMG
jgi:ribosomal-protein-serine acetyltransferase